MCIRDRYVIEREIPGAGNFSPDQLKAISQTSCGVLRDLGPQIQWVQSYVTDDKIYCVYIAPDEATVRKHAEQEMCIRDRVNTQTNEKSHLRGMPRWVRMNN